jgi:hypothetical protein
MEKTYRVLWMVLGGVVGGYFGYWLGHLAGWSTGADWPWRIGGGTGAILTSVGGALLGVLAVATLLGLPPYVRARRLRATGACASGSIVDRRDLGLELHARGFRGRQYGVVVDTRMPDGTQHRARATQWLTPAEAAALVPGARATVRYDPAHPDRVAVDLPPEAPPAAAA